MNNKKYFDFLNKRATLPSIDPYAGLSDFHTQNALGFYGEEVVKKVFDIKGSVRIGDVYPDSAEEDKDKVFASGFLAVRKFFRHNSKAPGLGLMYGGSSGLLESAFNVGKAIGIRMFSSFFKTLVVLKEHLTERVEDAKRTGYVETLLGARLYLPQLNDPKKKNAGIRKVYNSPIQGSASNSIHIFILKVSEYIERYNLSKLQGNNIVDVINGNYYNRIVTTKGLKAIEIIRLNKALDLKPNGHTRVLILDKQGNTTKEYHRAVKIDYYLFEKYNMEIYH